MREFLLILLVLLSLLAIIFLAFGTHPAKAHGDHDWMRKYMNGDGISCCDKSDVVPISHAEANAAHIGAIIRAEFPVSGVRNVVISRIYQTEDHDGRAMVSKFGCLFRHFGG